MTFKRTYIVPSRDVLSQEGPAVRVRDVAAWAGFSKAKLLADGRAKALKVTWKRCGTRRWAFVERAEALRYLDAIEFHEEHCAK